MRQISRKYDRASVNPGVGIGVPLGKADIPPKRGFFVSVAWLRPCMGGPCVGAFGHAGPFPRYANPHGPALPNWRLGGGKKTAGKDPTMIKRRILTLNPSKARAAYHRACALASLHSSSSLSVRLARYNHHMQSARALAQESHCYTAVSGGDV